MDGLSEDDSAVDGGLGDALERMFWRDVLRHRKDLPPEPAEFAACLDRMGTELAGQLAGEYNLFIWRLEKCRPRIRAALAENLGASAEHTASAVSEPGSTATVASANTITTGLRRFQHQG